MASVTFSIPDDLKEQMRELSWINWSELAREEALKRIKLSEEFEEFKKIVSKSKLSEKDALELGRKVNKSLHNRYKKESNPK